MKLSNVATAGFRPATGELVIRIDQRALVADGPALEILRSWTTAVLQAEPEPAGGWNILHLELPAVEHLNSLGISFLYWLAGQLKGRPVTMRISIGTDTVRRVARFCRFERFAEIRELQLDAGEP